MTDEAFRTQDPIERFRQLLNRATALDRKLIPEPTAMTLATATPEGRPSARIVLLKSFDQDGFVFYTNYESRKGGELHANPFAALVFYWGAFEVQVRVEGKAVKLHEAEADAYFASRPRGSQIGAWASQQSRAMENEAELEARVAEFTKQYEGGEVPRPPHWSGYRVEPWVIEFWKGRESRLHERHRYTRAGSEWRVEILNP
jgi:pyridoxamine 5'-phosphate oxidase